MKHVALTDPSGLSLLESIPFETAPSTGPAHAMRAGVIGAQCFAGDRPFSQFAEALRTASEASAVAFYRFSGHAMKTVARAGNTLGLDLISASFAVEPGVDLCTVQRAGSSFTILRLGATNLSNDEIIWSDGNGAMIQEMATVLKDLWLHRKPGVINAALGHKRTAPSGPLSEANPFDLTRTERAVAQLLAEGLRPKMIAERMNCAMPTVRTHLRNLYAKTGAEGMLELVRLLTQQAGGAEA